jgi:hypothetical protein
VCSGTRSGRATHARARCAPPRRGVTRTHTHGAHRSARAQATQLTPPPPPPPPPTHTHTHLHEPLDAAQDVGARGPVVWVRLVVREHHAAGLGEAKPLLQAVLDALQNTRPGHSTAQHSTAQHSTAQHSTAQHSTAQHSTAQHTTAHVEAGATGGCRASTRTMHARTHVGAPTRLQPPANTCVHTTPARH